MCLVLIVLAVVIAFGINTKREAEPSFVVIHSDIQEKETAPIKININNATQEELETLPNIGAVTAGKIIAYRTENGGFGSINDLVKVDGIGDKTLAKIAGMICVN